MKRIIIAMVLALTLILTACTEADTVSHNIAKSADSFKVQRKIVFFNGITDNYLLTIEGLCAIDVNDERKITATCRVEDDRYKKHYLGLSDNVSYFVEQTDAKYEDPFHYKVIFRPETIVPDIELQTSK